MDLNKLKLMHEASKEYSKAIWTYCISTGLLYIVYVIFGNASIFDIAFVGILLLTSYHILWAFMDFAVFRMPQILEGKK